MPSNAWGALRRAASRLRGDRRGVAAVEFGLVAMPFLAVISATFELGYADFQNEMLANAVSDAGRAMLTGTMQAASVTTAQQFVSRYLCHATGGSLPASFNCDNLIVDVRTASSFAAGNTANDFYKNTNNQFCPGQPGQIVVLRVAYPLPAIFPANLFSRTAGVVSDVPGLTGRYHILLGAALFREENFAGAYATPAGC